MGGYHCPGGISFEVRYGRLQAQQRWCGTHRLQTITSPQQVLRVTFSRHPTSSGWPSSFRRRHDTQVARGRCRTGRFSETQPLTTTARRSSIFRAGRLTSFSMEWSLRQRWSGLHLLHSIVRQNSHAPFTRRISVTGVNPAATARVHEPQLSKEERDGGGGTAE